MKAKLEDPDAGYARQPGSEFIEKAADGGDGRFFLTSFCAEIIGKNDGTAAENVMSAWLFSKAPYDKESIGTLMIPAPVSFLSSLIFSISFAIFDFAPIQRRLFPSLIILLLESRVFKAFRIIG